MVGGFLLPASLEVQGKGTHLLLLPRLVLAEPGTMCSLAWSVAEVSPSLPLGQQGTDNSGWGNGKRGGDTSLNMDGKEEVEGQFLLMQGLIDPGCYPQGMVCCTLVEEGGDAESRACSRPCRAGHFSCTTIYKILDLPMGIGNLFLLWAACNPAPAAGCAPGSQQMLPREQKKGRP